MKRIPLILLIVVLLSLAVAATIFAQTGESTAIGEDGASLSIVETLPVTADVEVTINGQVYKLAIPVTVNIDAQQDLAQALLTAQVVDRIGDLQWLITAITEYEEAFDLSQFSTVEPSSPDNKLVVITSQLTNLGAEPFTYYLAVNDLYAYDTVGNLFDPSDFDCDDINPGASLTCTIVFDVPKTALILGLDMKVYDHKRIPFTAQE